MGSLTARFWSGRPQRLQRLQRFQRPLKQYSFDTALGYTTQLDDKTLLLKTPAHQLNNIEKSFLPAGWLNSTRRPLPATRGEKLSTVCL